MSNHSSFHHRSSGGHDYKRHIVIAIDLSDQSLRALQWAAVEMYRPGDCFHVVHVNRCLQPQMTIQHTYPGTTFTIPDLHPFNERQHSEQIREIIKARFLLELDARTIPYHVHLFLDTDNAPASAVSATLFKVAADCDAVCMVMASHNKAYGWNELLLGSVAEYCTRQAKVPIMAVREYRAPLVIPASAASQPSSTATTPR